MYRELRSPGGHLVWSELLFFRLHHAFLEPRGSSNLIRVVVVLRCAMHFRSRGLIWFDQNCSFFMVHPAIRSPGAHLVWSELLFLSRGASIRSPQAHLIWSELVLFQRALCISEPRGYHIWFELFFKVHHAFRSLGAHPIWSELLFFQGVQRISDRRGSSNIWSKRVQCPMRNWYLPQP